MTEQDNIDTVPLMQAAQSLGQTYHQVLRLVLLGKLSGFQTGTGRWRVSRPSLLKLAKARRRAQRRELQEA